MPRKNRRKNTKKERSSKRWCSCGYVNRGLGHHEEGEHHKTGKGKAPALGPFIDGTSLDAPYRSCIYYYSND